MEELKTSLKKWYLLDKKIEELNQEVSRLREKRKETESEVILHMKKNNLHDKKLNIGPISVIYSSSMQLPPYNIELIEEALDSIYNKGSPQSLQFLQTLHSKRENNRKPNHCIRKRKNKNTKKVNRQCQHNEQKDM